MGTPDFLVIGHITKDLLQDGTFRLGGTAFYACLAAVRLGYRVAVYTAASRDLDLTPLLEATAGIRLVSRPAPADTVFCNRYYEGQRQQLLLDRAVPLSPEDLPPTWRSIPLVLLGPVAQEVSPAWVHLFPDAIVGSCLQGWLRGWDEAGRVHFQPWEGAERWLPHFTAAFLSEEDVREEPIWVERYAARCPLLVLTAGWRGAILYQQERPCPVAPFPVQEVDPTGAGDIFAAAFLVRYAEGAAAEEAARFASAAAALSVRGFGSEAIPRRAEVDRMLQEGADGITAP